MVKLKKSKKKSNANEEALELKEELSCENPLVPIDAKEEVLESSEKKGDKKKAKKDQDKFDELAKLLNKKVEIVKDESYVFHLRKILNRIGKVVVRYPIKDADFEKLLINAEIFNMDGIVLSPVYLNTCAKYYKKNKLNYLPVSTLIDFPFGESLLKSKITEAKNSIKKGADGAIVMLPVTLTLQDKVKDLKKQFVKLARIYNGAVSVAINASDVTKDDLKRTIKLAEKCGLKKITIVFGNETLNFVESTLQIAKSASKVLAIHTISNVETVEVAMALFELGASAVYTPYADEIGKDLFERFSIKSVKLV